MTEQKIIYIKNFFNLQKYGDVTHLCALSFIDMNMNTIQQVGYVNPTHRGKMR